MSATFDKPSISAAAASRMIAAAEAKATELEWPMVIAIVDDSGVLKAFSRMDGTPVIAVQVALDKAYTATFGMRTDAWPDFLQRRDPPLAPGSYTGIDRLVMFGGGAPIKVDDTVVGGIGVSGGPYEIEVAEAALAVLG